MMSVQNQDHVVTTVHMMHACGTAAGTVLSHTHYAHVCIACDVVVHAQLFAVAGGRSQHAHTLLPLRPGRSSARRTQASGAGLQAKSEAAQEGRKEGRKEGKALVSRRLCRNESWCVIEETGVEKKLEERNVRLRTWRPI